MKTRLLLLSMICAFASSATAAPPDVTNINASQRNGTKLVDVTYNLTLDPGQTAFVELWFSPDNGLTFPVRCTAITGDVNASVSAGTGKAVVWNAEADWDQQFTNNGKIRVIATYGNQPSGFAGSGSSSGGGSGSGSGYGNLNSVPWNPYYEPGGGPGSWDNRGGPVADPGPDGIPGNGDDGMTMNWAQDITGSTLTNIHADATEVTNAKWNEVATWGRNNNYTNLQDAPANDDNPRANVTFWDALRWCNARSEKEGLTPAYYMDSNEAVIDANQNGIYEAGEYHDLDGNGQYSPGLTTVFRAGANIPNYGKNISTHIFLPIKKDANGYRLPSYFTFFKLATGGNHQKQWPWGDENPPGLGAPEFSDFAQYVRATSGSVNFTSASPATSRQPNGYGLKDVIGNVAEWSEDGSEYDDGTGNVSFTAPTLGGSYAGLGGGGHTISNLWSLQAQQPGTTTSPIIGLRCVRYEQ
jgi:formylglycine-generating enzyme required for sulfatase activity